ncbi:MAG: hypothetical protein N5P05_002868 [Chroococcopsis gigantea SAG 12.99]|jgi:hypothetical protein|nr:hypothetical protein [Chlorogloea purpurea SAG 13.99]MDV3001262.1 hypothetical protein [Chroococcopsis gigantea SAG 12.99]
MQAAHRDNWGYFGSLFVVKSFLIWSFILTVCLLVVGFPLIVLMMTVGALSAIVLHSVLPGSSVLLVAGTILSLNLMVILASAAILAVKGVHPHEIHWFRWLQPDDKLNPTTVFASCPLTCNVVR